MHKMGRDEQADRADIDQTMKLVYFFALVPLAVQSIEIAPKQESVEEQLNLVNRIRSDLLTALQGGPYAFCRSIELYGEGPYIWSALVSLHLQLIADPRDNRELNLYRDNILSCFDYESDSPPSEFYRATLPLVSIHSENPSEKLLALLCEFMSADENDDDSALCEEAEDQQKKRRNDGYLLDYILEVYC